MDKRTTAHIVRERGFSLFEVLITVIVISIGLLGMAGLQFAGMRSANSAQDHTLATLLAQDVEERIRLNKTGANNGKYNDVDIDTSSSYPSVDCSTTSCNWGSLVNYDFHQWSQMIAPTSGSPVLPNASIRITSNNGINFQVTINWGDPSGPQTLTTSFSL